MKTSKCIEANTQRAQLKHSFFVNTLYVVLNYKYKTSTGADDQSAVSQILAVESKIS